MKLKEEENLTMQPMSLRTKNTVDNKLTALLFTHLKLFLGCR